MTALFNLGEAKDESITVDLARLGFKNPVSIRDLWVKEELGDFRDEFSTVIEPHGAGLFKITPK